MRFSQANYDAYQAKRAASSAKPERVVRHEPVATKERKAGNATRIHVRVTSFRRRLLDPDNLCPKYFIDCLRYAGLIQDDRAADIALEVEQFKVKTAAEERTEILISAP